MQKVKCLKTAVFLDGLLLGSTNRLQRNFMKLCIEIVQYILFPWWLCLAAMF